jgi:hypothetical protein
MLRRGAPAGNNSAWRGNFTAQARQIFVVRRVVVEILFYISETPYLPVQEF